MVISYLIVKSVTAARDFMALALPFSLTLKHGRE